MLTRGPMPKEYLAQREQQKHLFVNVTCDGCGAVVLNVKARTLEGQRQTQLLLARQALAGHVKKTGCSGQKAPPTAAKLAEAAGPELDALAEQLGVSREEAATLAADAMAGLRPGQLPSLADLERTLSNAQAAGGMPDTLLVAPAKAEGWEADPGTFTTAPEPGS